MKQRLPLLLSATALLVALFGSTPLGTAARQAIPPLAQHAKTADVADNAKRLTDSRLRADRGSEQFRCC